MNALRTLLLLSFGGLAIFAILGMLGMLGMSVGGRTAPPVSGSSLPCNAHTAVATVATAEQVPVRTREQVADPSDLDAAAPEAPQTMPQKLPLTLELYGPDEWLQGVPVSVVWDINAEGRGLESVLSTDAAGRARIHVQQFEQRPTWFWADLGFPTLGLAAQPIPPDGGTVVLSMVMPAYAQIVVAEEDGTALQEEFFVEVRAPQARAPSNRWIRVAMVNGRGPIPVEAGVQFEARVITMSGRETLVALQAPVEPEETVECRLVLASRGGVSLDLYNPDGSIVAHTPIRLIDRASRIDAMPFQPRTDASGRLRFRLPSRYEWLGSADLILATDIGGEMRYAELLLDLHHLVDGYHGGAIALKPLPPLLGGVVGNGLGGTGGRVDLVLELGMPSIRDPDNGALVWRRVDQTTSDDKGSFTFHGLAPRGGELRVRGPLSRSHVVFPVQAGSFDHQIIVPREATSRPDRVRRMLELMAAADARDS